MILEPASSWGHGCSQTLGSTVFDGWRALSEDWGLGRRQWPYLHYPDSSLRPEGAMQGVQHCQELSADKWGQAAGASF